MKRKLILRNFLSPGDLVMLTAAVRDLHRCHPGRFLTDVRSSCPELWLHNPHLTPLRESARGVETIDCHYPLIDRSDETPCHCIHGFADFLSRRLQLDFRPTLFHGDIHLSREERGWKSTVHELAGCDLPFWIINAGGKFDFTIKWWDWRRYQQVVDHFRGKILFVQIGDIGHHHPPLRNVVDLRGRTDLRQLVRLVYHAQGVLCGVTALMHLAAAVPVRPDRPRARAAVIVAGGREPTHWEAYPHHQFLHTIGALKCCATGGCWRARTRALGDGEATDQPKNLCVNVVRDLPRCMDMISAEEVSRRIETYFDGGANRYLTAREHRAAPRAVARSLEGPRFDSTINLGSVRAALDSAAREARRAKAPAMSGRGVVLFAARREDFAGVIESAGRVRSLGCELPVECWAGAPVPPRSAARLRTLHVRVCETPQPHGGATPMTGAELRQHVLAHTTFREVLLLEPGALPPAVPDLLFESHAFRRAGALFFDPQKNCARPGVWKICALKFPRRTAGAARVLIDRSRCWSALTLWRWIADRTYFFHGYVDGDGGAAQLAFAKLARPLPLARGRPSS